ncbi:M14 family metallopeptidase [Shewanella woodyi]|uniref:Peptidase M14 carboxypeptidase A n=1 Tax=Shewanella woodyi (strain ATCC 51908 / MS32) TaxID=392500 RepID=B1KNR5_SHEWM|nr:M14 family zinc carboxypeptidase [Shewanella woodyi]ACA87523.1 peptidase M14 carboxypeptidase A [Shewanella woodyi ATCC 51908]
MLFPYKLVTAVFYTGLSLLFFTACQSVSTSNENNCHFANVKFETDFSTGRLDRCQQLSDTRFLLTLRPENRPINDSAWYAFKLVTQSPQEVEIVMEVEGGKHRYLPKVSRDGEIWSLKEYKLRSQQLKMHFAATDQPIWVAGQEIIDNQDYLEWGEALMAQGKANHEQLGLSTEQRPIMKLEASTDKEGKEWLLVLGRQHPPELTGAMALFPFSEVLLSNTQLAKEFRERFNIVIIPNLNPDGVEVGNWRHNANGVDLNRDWGKFKQAETRVVASYLERLIASGDKIHFAVDFHSTRKDIFYTMPSDYGLQNPQMVEHWLDELDNQYTGFKVIQQPGNNPDIGVFKQYIADKYGVHAITYEMGDNTNRRFIDNLAINAANSLMQTMLASKPVE